MALTHDNNGTLIVQNDTIAFHALCAALDNLSQPQVEWVSEADMANYAALEESKGPNALGAVDDLVRDDKVHWLDLLLQRTHGRKGNDAADTDMPQSSDVGPVGHFVRRVLVVQAVSGEKGNIGAVVRQDLDGRRRRTPGGNGVNGGNGLVTLELAKSCTANDGDVDRLY
jgi:hypothetical protein